MSDHEVDKSLISAYCDGELNAAEQSRVEALLERSETARAELSSYRRMSNLLRDASRHQVRADLVSSVMSAIEELETAAIPGGPRSSSVTQPASTGSTAPNKSKSSPQTVSRGSSTSRIWVAVAASAACVALAWLGWRGNDGGGQLAHRDTPVPVESDLSVNHQGAEAVGPGRTGKNRVIAEHSSTPSDQHAVDKNDRNSATEVANGVTAPAAGSPSVNPPVVPPLRADQIPVELIADLKNSNVGHITRFIRQNQDGVTVFHLMVVDMKPGLASLEMILSAQQISRVDGKPLPGRTDAVAVYVEARQEKMEGLVQQLKTEHEKFLALAVQEQAVPMEQVAALKPKSTSGEQAVPIDAGMLKSVGVEPLQPIQIEMARNQPRGRSGFKLPPRSLANKNQVTGETESPLYKVLILVEKATPESLQNQPN